ncbi:MAG: hypothetical protein ACHP84_17185 [Caulobacterales bacterium]
MRKIIPWLLLTLFVVAAGGVLYLFWSLDWRWRPHTVGRNQTQIAQALEQSGWVSPHNPGPRLYIVAYRSCEACNSFAQKEFTKLQAAGVDTRVIMVARPDLNGLAQSTNAERATVAELWINRRWSLYQGWAASTPEAWTAAGVAPADGDLARAAVVEAGRKFAVDLPALLKPNGVGAGYPTLVWWTKDGKMRACVCDAPQTWGNVEKELGA